MGEVLELDTESLEALAGEVCHEDLLALGFRQPASETSGTISEFGAFKGLMIGLPIAIALWALVLAVPYLLYTLIA